jgi:drug/metabolite transporter (DMT)-like permease
MLFLILSIVCSVTVGVLFKWLRKHAAFNSKAIIATNYAIALLLCYFCFLPEFSTLAEQAPWPLYLALGLLLPSVFLLLSQSIQHIGIVKTDAAQRLSLFLPLLASWLLFGEQFSTLKVWAFSLGFPALLLILSKPTANSNSNWGYPVMVLLGFGAVDILFKQIALQTQMPFTTSLLVIFALALLIMSGVVGYEIFIQRQKIAGINLLWGVAVGVFNFGNIYFYLKAHQAFSENPSTVFAGMNMGVIVLGSLIGVLIFKEKLSRKNYLGIFLALLAIVLLTYAQLQA